MEVIGLLVQLLLLLECVRRIPLISAPVILMSYLVFGELLYLLAENYVIPFTIADPTVRPGIFQSRVMFPVVLASVFLTAWASTFNLRFKVVKTETISASTSYVVEIVSIMVGYIWVLINLGTEQPSLLWYNSHYLAAQTPDYLIADRAIFAPFLVSMPVIGIALAVTLGLAIRRGAGRTALFISVPFLYIFLFYFTQHSRVAAIQVAALAAIFLDARSLWLKGIGWAVTAFAGFVWLAALTGRAIGENGFAALPDTVASAFQGDGVDLITRGIGNVFEGIFVLSYSSLMTLSYPTNYKVLSFSPVFSFIDKFDKIRLASEIRVSVNVPVSGYAEAYSFGPFYFIFLLIVLFAAFRLSIILLERRGGLVGQLANFVVAINAVLLFAYNVRNGFRLIAYSIILCVLLMSWESILRVVRQRGSGRQQAPGATSPLRARF